MKRGLGRAGCLLPELNPRQHMHKHLPARTRKSFGRSAERNLTSSRLQMGGQKGDNLEKTNDSRMPILCKHAFACCGGSEPNLRFQPGWTTDHKCRFRQKHGDRKSTRLNSSHGYISYAVFCLKKKNKIRKN